MKKITLLICVIVASAAMYAAPHKKAVKTQAPTIHVVEGSLDGSRHVNFAAKAGGVDSIQVPYRTYQPTYRIGKPADGFDYDYYSQGLVSEYTESIIFFNDSMWPADWYIGEEKVGSNVAYINRAVKFDDNDVPMMKITGKKDTLIFDWQIANQYVKKYWEGHSDFYSTLQVAPASYVPITSCTRYTEDPRESQYGRDLYSVSAPAALGGKYCYGTDLKNPWQTGSTFDSIMVIFENSDVMNIDFMTLAIYTNASSYKAIFPGENDHVRLTLYPCKLTQNNIIVNWTKPIASTTANLDNFTPAEDEDGNPQDYGMLQFDFMEEDPVTGAMTPAPVVVKGNFVAVLDEYNDGTADFGIFSDYYKNGTGLNTYFPWFNIAEGKQYISPVFGQDIMLSAEAYFPVFKAQEEVVFGLEGGKKEIAVVTNVWNNAALEGAEDAELSSDEDWISGELETGYEVKSQYTYHTYTGTLTINVEAADEAREGKLLVNALGKEVEITIKQTNDPQGINNVKAVNDNKLYNVLGMEVNEDYKGVVIRNGQKFVR